MNRLTAKSSPPGSQTSNLLPFQKRSYFSTQELELSEMPSDFLLSTELEEQLRTLVNSFVSSMYLKAKRQEFAVTDDPFDAVYISELRADSIQPGDISMLDKFSQLKDLSDSISFSDGWDE